MSKLKNSPGEQIIIPPTLCVYNCFSIHMNERIGRRMKIVILFLDNWLNLLIIYSEEAEVSTNIITSIKHST